MDYCSSCKHDTQKITTGANSIICTGCGLEQNTPYDLSAEPYDWTRVPVITCYSRKKRFAKLFDHTVNPYAETNDNDMLRYLAQRGSVETISDLIKRIKKSKLKDKRYGSIHIFAKLFVTSYKRPPIPHNLFVLRKQILRRFEDYEFAHKRYCRNNFFNYRWLLAKLLQELNLGAFLIFVKRLKCPNRCRFYEELYKELNLKLKSSPTSCQALW